MGHEMVKVRSRRVESRESRVESGIGRTGKMAGRQDDRMTETVSSNDEEDWS